MKTLNRIIENGSFLVANPYLTFRLIKNYSRSIFLRQYPLRTVDITFDYQCNYKCKHCYAVDFADSRRKKMNLEDYKNIVDKCIQEGAIHFNLVGGEPTMDERLFDVVAHMKKKKAVVSLATNGSFLTLEYVQKLKDVGVDVVLLSMDLLDKAALDRFRNEGCYEDVMSAMKNCIAVNMKIFISAVITPESLKDGSTIQLLKFCVDNNILLHTNLPAIMGRWRDATQMYLSKEDQDAVREIYKHSSVRSCEMSSYFKSACRSGWEKLHVTEYGDVMPCTFVPIHFGNILVDDLEGIRKKMHQYSLFQKQGEMCMPSTDKAYQQLYEEKISKNKVMPVFYKDLE